MAKAGTITIKIDSSEVKPVLDALTLAMKLIESYQLDIRGAKDTFGFDLEEVGFCQGFFYKDTIAEIKELLGDK